MMEILATIGALALIVIVVGALGFFVILGEGMKR